MEHIAIFLTLGEWEKAVKAIPAATDRRTQVQFRVDEDQVQVIDANDRVLAQLPRQRFPEPYQSPAI